MLRAARIPSSKANPTSPAGGGAVFYHRGATERWLNRICQAD
jgi:hypothetical protein